MITYLSHEGETTHRHRLHHGFGVHDRKGRELGVHIGTWQVTQLAGPKTHRSTWPHTPEREWLTGSTTLQPGLYFCWLGCATRAGEMFGAGQPRHYCKTEAERDQQIAKYIRDARARAEKRAALEATVKG